MKKINLYILLILVVGFSILTSCKNTSPTVIINTPADNSIYLNGQNVEFSAKINDEEDVTISEDKIIWKSDKDGEIGKGTSFIINNLSVNTHLITVTATDSKDLVTEKQVTVVINQSNFSFGNVIPQNESEFIETENIVFSCNPQFENNDLIDESKLIWTSDIDGQIGTGLSFEKKLSANNHKITIAYNGEIVYSYDFNLVILENSVNIYYTPLPYSKYYEGYEITLACFAQNLDESSINDEDIIWTSDKDGIIGTGFSFNISNLSINTHQITISAENELGHSSEFNFNLQIIENNISDFELLLDRITGYYSSQNHADTTTNQYIVDVRLHMAQIWSNRNVGDNIYWLYVEQAYADDLEHPYRQRIYKVILDPDGTMRDEIYSIANAATYLHGYNNVQVFDALQTSGLTLKENCGLYFTWNANNNIFDGATVGTSCLATIPGLPQVQYITSVTTIGETLLTSWDRGYSSTGAWLLGPDWPYIFDLVTDYNFTSSK